MRFPTIASLCGLLLWSSCRSAEPSRWNVLDPALEPRLSLAEGLWRKAGPLAADRPERGVLLADAEADLQSLLAAAPDYFPAHRLLQDVRLARDPAAARTTYGVPEVPAGQAPDDSTLGGGQVAPEIVLALAARALLPDDREGARALLERSTAVSPRFPWAWYGLGYLSWLEGDHEAAEGFVAKALRFDPELEDALRLEIELEDEAGDWEAAIEACKAVLDLDPDAIEVLLRLAHLQLGSEDERLVRHAEGRLREVLKRIGDPPPAEQVVLKRDAYLDLGAALILEGRGHEALPVLREALLLDRDCLRALYDIAWVHEHVLGDDQKALETLELYQARSVRKGGERSFEELLDELFFVEVNVKRLKDRIAAAAAEAAKTAPQAPKTPEEGR